MSDENGQEIGVNAYDDNDEDGLIEDEEAAAVAPQPVGVVREEIVTIKNSDTEDNDSEDQLHEVVKAHSYQISRLTEIVESLQSQVKLIDQKRTSSNNKTSSIRKNRSTTKTKKNKATAKKSKGKSTKRK